MNLVKIVSILSVMLLAIVGASALIDSENTDGATSDGYTRGTASDPLTGLNGVAIDFGDSTYYLQKGSSVRITIDDEGMMNVKTVTSGFGLSISNKILSGNVTKTGTIDITFTNLMDNGKNPAQIIVVDISGGNGGSTEPTLDFENPGRLNAISGSSFQYTPSVNISGTTFTKISGVDWLSVSNGKIVGTITTVTEKTTFTAVFQATSPNGQTANQTITFEVFPIFNITSTPPSATIIAGYNFAYTVTSNMSGAEFTITNAPEWIAILDGVISGTAPSDITVSQNITFTVTATFTLNDDTLTKTQSVSFKVDPVLSWTSVPTADMLIVPIFDDTTTVTIDQSMVMASTTDTEYKTAKYKFVFTGEQADSVLWDFGDGNTSTDYTAFHTYEKSGTYKVTITAKNDKGTDVSFKTIIVNFDDNDSSFISKYLGYIILAVLVIGIIVVFSKPKKG